jgi:hypothetical protein
VQQHLGVAVIGLESVACRLKLGAECAVVVDAAVENDSEGVGEVGKLPVVDGVVGLAVEEEGVKRDAGR